MNFRPWSYSRLSTAETCLLQFWIVYVQKFRGNATMPISNGKKRHKFLETKILAGADQDHQPVEGQGPEDLIAWEKVKKFAQGSKAEKTYIIDIDCNKAMEKNEPGFLLGILDVVTNDSVIDWKCGQGLVTNERRLQYHDQADIYAVLYNTFSVEKWPFMVSIMHPYSDEEDVTFNYKPDGSLTTIFERIKKRILDAEETVLVLDPEKIGEWEPNYEACDDCLVWNACPVYPQVKFELEKSWQKSKTKK